MQKKERPISSRRKYECASVLSVSLESDCSFLSASLYITNDGQGLGPEYNMGLEDNNGLIFNPDWDFGE